jgi:protein ImuB
MLWAALRFPHFAIEIRAPRDEEPAAVCERSRSQRILIASNEAARDRGILAGLTAPQALLKEPNLRLIERAKSDEKRSLRALADWALQFSSTIHQDLERWLLWIEIGASLRYFDGLALIGGHIARGIAELGYEAELGIAPTLEAAALLTFKPGAGPVLNRAGLYADLASLPAQHLRLADDVKEHLTASGVTRVGAVLDLPRSGLARRFGPEVTRYLQRLLGEAPDVRPHHVGRTWYRRRYDFADPIHSLEALLFPLRRVLQEFEGFLRGHDVAVQRVEIALKHRDSQPTAFTLHTSAPIRDAHRLFALLREKLEHIPWAEPVTEMFVEANEFQSPEIIQGDFFDESERRKAGWIALLDKLRARLGEDAVRMLGLKDDHRPEHAWCIQHDSQNESPDEILTDRPLWLLTPRPIARPPTVFGTPERIEAGWRTGEEALRDYYVCISEDGARWWLFRDLATQQWYLHGLWG